MIGRHDIAQGYFQKMAATAHAQGLLRLLSAEERRTSLDRTLAARPAGAAIWVFAYGSLMWNPAFHFAERRRARLFGYHRSFCLRTPIGRGCEERPGLLLGLDRGGSCRGMAYRIAEDTGNGELDIIWAREMVADGYRPRWLTLRDEEGGGPLPAIAFTINRASDRYAPGLNREETARQIARASGPLGTCAEYLEKTVDALDAIGITDGPMHLLLAQVNRHRQSEGAAP